MKKIVITLLALVICNVMGWAEVSISINPTVIDFGTVELDANGEAEPDDWKTAELTWSGLIDYCSVFVDTIDAPAIDADYEFYIESTEGNDFWYGGIGQYSEPADDPTVYVKFYAVAAGEYSITYRFYSYESDDDWYYNTNKKGNAELTVKVKVVDPKTTGIETIQNAEIRCRKILQNGQVKILRNGETYSITGERISE